MSKAKDSHVVYDYSSPRSVWMVLPDEQMVLVCMHCGDVFRAALPLPIGMAVAIMREYGRAHRSCRVYGPVRPAGSEL